MIEPICSECGDSLTEEERNYYVYRCESCERCWHERVTAWRHGAPDDELDKLYDGLNIKPIIH